MTDSRRDPYKGRQMYPKDTVTKKQMDRKVDRVETRLDHLLERVRGIATDVGLLRTQLSRVLLFERYEQEAEEE